MKAKELKYTKLPEADRQYILKLIEENFNIPQDKAATFIAWYKLNFLRKYRFDPKDVIIPSDPEAIEKILSRQKKPKGSTRVGNPAATRRNEFIEITIEKCQDFLRQNNFTGTQTDQLFFTALVMTHTGLFISPLNYETGIDYWRIETTDFLRNYTNYLKNYFRK